MRKIFNICDKLAVEFSIVFNAKNLSVWYFNQSAKVIVFPSRLPFIGGNAIESVDKWPHLGLINQNHM
jgi:hypothetical protein